LECKNRVSSETAKKNFDF